MSTAEVAIEACRKGGYYGYGGYYDYEAVTHCYPYVSWGAGIWCSVLVSFDNKKSCYYVIHSIVSILVDLYIFT